MSKLICISYFGARFWHHRQDSDLRTKAHSRGFLNDVAPQNRWAFDLLNDEGGAKPRVVVAAVKEMAANL
ncbi:hypothetical protein M404DRAFT_997632 [Pisolithus tinctorius Marx 270]|uniref:Uncharacterized protein n=1 Tax=Pisolithus tinctorius Marx 270 TaxID=870435 RepID=A0A0C3PHJ4_PISTI|nr:hypothetical protein M404DRAFT_997632 [Pisolithus tinctorius Marx 270]